MKKLLLSAFALSLLLSACNVLDKEPLASIAPANFYQNAEDAEAGITAVYDAIQGTGAYGQDLIMVGEMPTDNCTTTNGDVLPLDNFIWNPRTSQVYNVFRDAYLCINRANSVIKYVPGISMTEARRNEIVGEAYFLRALSYFHLVQLYGGVPLRLEPTESGASDAVTQARASAEDIYRQIEQDLTSAAGMVSTTATSVRVSKGAVQALQARVFLTERKWAEAQAAANAVITSGNYSLVTDYKSLWPANNVAGESILEVQYAGNDDGGNIVPDLVLPSPPASYSFPKFNIPTAELISSADTANDNRWKYIGTTPAGRDHVSYVDGGPGGGNDDGPFVYKWPVDPNFFNSPDNTYVLRYSEVLLAFAEAANEQGQSGPALEKLNIVRQRAGLPALTTTDKAELRRAIDRDRRLELAFEGLRWFDLLRYARHEQADASAQHDVTALDLIQAKRGNPDANYLLLPIPQQEMNNNPKSQQNPGY